MTTDLRTLDEIGHAYGTDKAWAHQYLDTYEQYLAPLRDKPVRLLELGWGGPEGPDAGGASARMWRDYFENAESVVILDLDPHVTRPDDVGITLIRGDQSNPAMLAHLRDRGPWDVIVDDCSHVHRLTIASFEGLWESVRPGGFYIIEDTHTAYQEAYGGDRDPLYNGPRRNIMRYMADLVDQVNVKVGGSTYINPEFRSHEIDLVAFHPGMVVLRKRAVAVLHD